METIGSKRSYALTWCMPNNDDDDNDDDDDDDDDDVWLITLRMTYGITRSNHCLA